MVADADDVVVAYASVAMTGIDCSAAPEAVANGAPDPLPPCCSAGSQSITDTRA
ncbi:MAG: hypothetical protein ACRET5_19865 [Steroidobacteraceae bacterium]